jgi:hypothetical protein
MSWRPMTTLGQRGAVISGWPRAGDAGAQARAVEPGWELSERERVGETRVNARSQAEPPFGRAVQQLPSFGPAVSESDWPAGLFVGYSRRRLRPDAHDPA